MRTLALACAFLTLTFTPAFACRGTAEYPEVAAQLVLLNLAPAERQAYEQKLSEGEELHGRGHDLDDATLRRESLKILDEIKERISQ